MGSNCRYCGKPDTPIRQVPAPVPCSDCYCADCTQKCQDEYMEMWKDAMEPAWREREREDFVRLLAIPPAPRVPEAECERRVREAVGVAVDRAARIVEYADPWIGIDWADEIAREIRQIQ